MFIGSCAGNFYALNKTTGEVQWSYDIRKDGKQQSFHGDPLVISDLILIGTDRSCDPEGVGHVYAFERSSGNVRWSTVRPAFLRTSFKLAQMCSLEVSTTGGPQSIYVPVN